jgi:hypothetical protein
MSICARSFPWGHEVFNPVVGHPTCDLDLQRRIRAARKDSVARSVGRAHRKPSLFDRVLGRHPGERPVTVDADALHAEGHEDVWRSLRF